MLSAVFLAFFGAIVTLTDDSVEFDKGALRRCGLVDVVKMEDENQSRIFCSGSEILAHDGSQHVTSHESQSPMHARTLFVCSPSFNVPYGLLSHCSIVRL